MVTRSHTERRWVIRTSPEDDLASITRIFTVAKAEEMLSLSLSVFLMYMTRALTYVCTRSHECYTINVSVATKDF